MLYYIYQLDSKSAYTLKELVPEFASVSGRK